MNIALVGMPGAGKTSVGRALARRMELEFFDVDRMIEARFGTIPKIFACFGEERFRALETEALKEAVSSPGAVIAAGGGALQKSENAALLKRCKTVYLRVKPETLFKRLLGDKMRPLFQEAKTEDALFQKINELYEARRKNFETAANVTLDADELTIEEAAQILSLRLKEEP